MIPMMRLKKIVDTAGIRTWQGGYDLN